MFYDLHNTSRAVGVSYIAGSVTTYSDTNPGYRIYTMDGNYTGSSWVRDSVCVCVCVCVCVHPKQAGGHNTVALNEIKSSNRI